MKKYILLLVVVLATVTTSTAQSRRKVSDQTKQGIVEQLVRAEEIRAECVQEAGGAEKVVNISLADLNRDGKPEFFVEGAASCAYGGRFADKWVFRESSSGYELLLSPGPVDDVSPLRTYTNGYLDIKVTMSGSVNGEVAVLMYKFDGSTYIEVEAPLPPVGFREQKFEPSPLDELGKPVLTPDEQNVAPEDVGEIEVAKNSVGFSFNTHPMIQQFINYYQGRGRSTMEAGLRRSGQFIKMVRKIFREEGVPEDIIWLAQVESQWNPKHSTPRGVGLWQFSVNRGKAYGLRLTPWVNERMSLEKATRAAARYLKFLAGRYKGNWELAIAAYLTGEGDIDHAISQAGRADFWALYPYLAQDKRNYVPNVVATILVSKNPEKYGFLNIRPDAPLSYDVLEVPTATSLQLLAQATDVSIDYIRTLNPELRRDTTPRGEAYRVRIPGGKAYQLVAALKVVPPDRRDRLPADASESDVTSAAQTPKLPYRDVGACPFECCTYRQWVANQDTFIYREMRDGSPIAFIVKRREEVTGVTGVVITTAAGQVKALRNKKLEHISVEAGDVLYTLTYLGEGYYKIWYKGEITTEAFYEEPSMKVLSKPEAIWWVKIKNRKGQIGWTKLPENFDNKDACGTPQPETTPTVPPRRANQPATQIKFTINRECDGGLCHFEIVSFNYRGNLSISVGRGDSSLSYYFSIQITNGKVSKEYIYSDKPEEHFVEKESGQTVDTTLNRLLLDVYNLGNYIVDNNIAIRNRRFSETGRFAVLANLRTHADSVRSITKKFSDLSQADRKAIREHLKKAQEFYEAKRDDETLTELRYVLKINPMESEAYLLIGKMQLRRDELEQAIGSLKTALFWDKKLIEGYILLGNIFLNRDDLTQANVYAQEALKLDSENQQAISLSHQIEQRKNRQL